MQKLQLLEIMHNTKKMFCFSVITLICFHYESRLTFHALQGHYCLLGKQVLYINIFFFSLMWPSYNKNTVQYIRSNKK